MSVHSQSTAPYAAAAAPEFPRHVVTAVLVAHDGARWLPTVLAGLLGQERPVQQVVAADTGSADDCTSHAVRASVRLSTRRSARPVNSPPTICRT
jgi:hypothetical protein